MRCHICNRDCPDGEIRIEKNKGMVKFMPCKECTDVIQKTVLMKEIEDEETPTIPLWDLD